MLSVVGMRLVLSLRVGFSGGRPSPQTSQLLQTRDPPRVLIQAEAQRVGALRREGSGRLRGGEAGAGAGAGAGEEDVCLSVAGLEVLGIQIQVQHRVIAAFTRLRTEVDMQSVELVATKQDRHPGERVGVARD